MGTTKLISDRKIKRWPYFDDGRWHVSKVNYFNPKLFRIGSHPGGTKSRAHAEYEAKYGFKIAEGEFYALNQMSRYERRRWCLARRK